MTQPRNNPERLRYEIEIDGRIAGHADYRREDGAIRFTHTEVAPEFEGQGVGSRLAKFALDDARRQGLKAIAQCRFIASYIARHEQDYADLVVRE